MSDLISRLSELRCQYNCFDENERDAYHTLSEAIKALSDVLDTNVGDTISRQAAKLKVARVIWEDGDSCYDFHDKCVDCLDDVPSAQPEIIRCEYCAHRNQYRFPPKYEVKDYCEVHEKVTALNNFCSWADRR